MIKIVIVGHVDHGKSTILGRLLFELDALPEGKIEQIRNECRKRGKNFEYAFLLDALKEERQQGITIDTARCFFSYEGRKYLFFDSPGHIEFIKNMVTGASQTDSALIVVDALEGIRENSRRHALLLSFFHISKIAVLINKMDLVSYQKRVFDSLKEEYQNFARNFGIQIDEFIPVSGNKGDNIKELSLNMPWYQGKTIIHLLKELKKEESLDILPLRLPVQDVYKFNDKNNDKRIIAGNILYGNLKEKDELVFLPSEKQAKVASIEVFSEKNGSENKKRALSGEAIGITLEPQIYVKRGEVAYKKAEKKPLIALQLEVNLFWLSAEPLQENKKYLLRIGMALKSFKVLKFLQILDTACLKEVKQKTLQQNNIALCLVLLDEPVVFDMQDAMVESKHFTIIDKGSLSGGGIIKKAVFSAEKTVLQKKENQDFSFLRAKGFSQKAQQRQNCYFVMGSNQNNNRIVIEQLEKHFQAQDLRTVVFQLLKKTTFAISHDLTQLLRLLLSGKTVVICELLELDLLKIKAWAENINSESCQFKTVFVGDDKNEALFADYFIERSVSDLSNFLSI